MIAPDWMTDAQCTTTDPETFFTGPEGVSFAKAVCRDCPVQTACLTYALDNEIDWGVWGGTTERERMKLRSAA